MEKKLARLKRLTEDCVPTVDSKDKIPFNFCKIFSKPNIIYIIPYGISNKTISFTIKPERILLVPSLVCPNGFQDGL